MSVFLFTAQPLAVERVGNILRFFAVRVSGSLVSASVQAEQDIAAVRADDERFENLTVVIRVTFLAAFILDAAHKFMSEMRL